MIAHVVPYPEEVLGPRVGSRAGRNAVRRRRGRRTLSRYLLLARIVVTVSVLTIAIGIYLALMANVTRMNYELTKNARAEARLADESARLEDEIAHPGSRRSSGCAIRRPSRRCRCRHPGARRNLPASPFFPG